VIDLLNLPWLPQKAPDATEVLDSRERLGQTALGEIARFAHMKLNERLKRRVEEQILQFVVDSARKAGAKRLKGIYRPTAKNGLVKNHYRDLGFEPGPSTGEEETWWLTIAAVASLSRDLPFELV
jgi:hypothetical protein